MAADGMSYYSYALLLLAGAVIAAPVAKRIGLGTVLGYLAAGILIGPILRLITNGEQILHFAELGIVFLLFIIGLELKPSSLWSLRREIFGLGLTQVVVTGLVLIGLVVALDRQNFGAAAVIGFGLALSSTAFGLQILEERGERSSTYGQRAFSILLFQDLAIVPILALVPLLAPYGDEANAQPLHDSILALGAIAVLILAGRYILNPMFQLIASTGAREAMIAAALLVVLGAAMLMDFVGLSMAMGSFLAGVLLAESSYRHELKADIEPFRGVLFALFFIAVGLSLDVKVVLENWLLISLSVLVLMVVKNLIIFALCRFFGSDTCDSLAIAGLLPQAGEFGFVIFTAASAAGVFSNATASQLIAIVTVSMALTPLASAIAKRLVPATSHEDMGQTFEGAGSDVLMIGFSRFGQIVSQTLLAGGSDVTIIDHSADRVRSATKFGFKIYFGDGTRRSVLQAAGIEQAKLAAICTHGKATTDKIVNLIQSDFPSTKIFARAYDRAHTLSLRERGIEYELRETVESSFLFSRALLDALGLGDERVKAILDETRRRDEERLQIQAVEGIYAGVNMLHTKPVTPEPLIKPKQEAERLDLDESAETAETE